MFSTEQIKSLNELELSIYQFVMENQKKVQYMKIRELAEETHVSTTTVLRFCRKMGCDGYAEFKIRYRQHLQEVENQKFSDSNLELIDCLKKTSSPEYEQKLDALARMMAAEKRIIFIGSGMSGISAKYGARYFSSIGKFCLYIDEPHYPTNCPFFENALVVVFSVSGESNDIIGHVNRLKQGKCKILSITNRENCTLARMSDYNLSYYVTYVRIGIYDITTQTPAINLIERLARKVHNILLEQRA